ncbi:50S ribosomal protein L28, partial [Borreliella bissettiae]
RSVNIKVSANALRSISKIGLDAFLKKNCKRIENFL